MTILLYTIIILINMLLQSSILSYWTIFGYAPNTALVCVIVISLIKGKYHGAFFGLAIGLLHDIIFGSVIGVNALVYFLIGYLCGMLQELLNVNNKIVPALLTAAATIMYNFLYYLFLFFLSRKTNLGDMFTYIISIEIVYNAVASVFVYMLFSKIFKKPSLDFRRGVRWFRWIFLINLKIDIKF